MKIKIEEEGETRTENISEHQRLLLRAAYIASFIREDDNFPHNLKKTFHAIQLWPIKIPKGDSDEKIQELTSRVNEWFEANLIRTMITFVYHPHGLERVYELIKDAIALPDSEKEVIPAWLHKEISYIAAESIQRQVKTLLKGR